MHLTRVSLLGFKSFAEKVDLAFEPGITAIVGPNGCGKSNVSDAIRWALGEQSAKLLRGDRMDDLIFAGTVRRKPLGLAEVSLTFSHANGDLPIPYEEINVTRRLFRSGESEYLLNKAPCRLRDVVELFIDTGLTGEPYALIEQGSIGSVVNARPLDRRALLEEAAGIMKYKLKRRTALAKLEATEQNLLRITDVIREVERQRNSLRRQAQRAERYKLLDERARFLRLTLKWAERAALLAERDQTREALQRLREERAGLEAALAAVEADLARLRLEDAARERALRQAEEELHAIRRRLDQLEADLRAGRQQREDLARREAEQARSLAEREGRATALRGTLAGLDERLDGFARGIRALEAEAVELAAGAAALDGDISAARETLEDLRRRVATRQMEMANARAHLSTLEERRRQVQAQLARLAREAAAAAAQRDEVAATTAREEGALATRAEGHRGLLARREELAGRRRGLEERKVGAASALAEGRAALDRLRGRLDSLRELEAGREGYAEGDRHLLGARAAGDEVLADLLGPLSEAIEVPPRYERAIEALLADALQGVRAPSLAAARLALDRLQRDGVAGRTTLLIATKGSEDGVRLLAALRAVDPGLLASVEAAALDLVRGAGADRAWLGPLLADALVVPDLEAAAALAPHLPPPYTLATLAGEVLDHRGILRAGGATPLLARRREIREAAEATAAAEARCAQLAEEEASLAGDIRAVEDELGEVEADLRAADLARVAAEKDLDQHRAEALRLSRQLELFGYEREAAERDAAALETAIDEAALAFREAEADATRLDAQRAALEEAASALEARRAALAERLTEVRVALSSAAAARAAAEADRVRIQGEIGEALAEAERFRGEGEAAAARLAELADAVGRLQEQAQASAAAEVAAAEACKGLHDARAAVQAQVAAAEERLHTLRARGSDVRDRAEAAATALAQVETTLSILEEALTAEHGLLLDQVPARLAGRELPLEAAREELEEVRAKLADLGPANLGALEEYEGLAQRADFLNAQAADLTESIRSLRAAIAEIQKTISALFQQTLEAVNAHFDRLWRRLFGGGAASLRLLEPEDGEEPGVEMVVRLPGKRMVNPNLLSGGEQALAGLALLLALSAVRPSPVCVLDEVDAPLDDANVERFVALLREMAADRQFIVITHNKRTMEAADLLYGITMEEEGVSKLISVRMQQAA